MKFLYTISFFIFAFCIYLYSYHLLHHDLLFHTDIARDFLLTDEIATTHKFTLIGPHAGGIPGVFFGPIWLYLNLPIFLIAHGNPIIVGYFWVSIMLIALGSVFFVARKVFNTTIAFL